MAMLVLFIVVVGIAALSHGFVRSRFIANFLPAVFVCSALVGYEYFFIQPERSALGGLILPFVFMAVLLVSLFVGMAMNLLKLSAFSRQP
jgi:hypothetical protein